MKNIIKLTAFSFLIITQIACTKNAEKTADTSEQESAVEETIVEKIAQPAGYAIGDTAADFSLENVDGSMVSLANYTDSKGFIVTFTCNHCPYAVAYESRIIALDKKYAPLGYPVIAISPNDPSIVPEDGMDAMKKLAEEKGYTFPYLLDAEQDVYVKYGATKTPHMFVLQKENDALIVKYIGAIDDNYEDENDVTERYVEDAIDALLSGTKIAVESTKAIGCSIKDNRFK